MFRKKGLYVENTYNPSTGKVTIGFGHKDGKVKHSVTMSTRQFKMWLERMNNFSKSVE